MAPVTYATLEDVAAAARPYPAELLDGCETGLVLFAAAFLGHNDAIHFAEAGVPFVTLVDRDDRRLAEMRSLYRDNRWQWIAGDAWEFARQARLSGDFWDAVSVDTFTGNDEIRALGNFRTWTAIAERLITVTATRDREVELPDGWEASRFERTGSVEWLVLERRDIVAA